MNKIKIPVYQEHWLEGLGSCRQQRCVTSLKFVFNASLKKKMHKSRETIDFSVEPKISTSRESRVQQFIWEGVKGRTGETHDPKWRKW